MADKGRPQSTGRESAGHYRRRPPVAAPAAKGRVRALAHGEEGAAPAKQGQLRGGAAAKHGGAPWYRRLPILEGILPIDWSQVPADAIAGVTLAALAVPEVMGYTMIAGTPVITGLYTILLPMALFALFRSSRHLVVGADSATAAILASGLAGLAAAGSSEWLALAGALALLAAAIIVVARRSRRPT
ncbi:MAG TPA: SulP family inorganic anion transporter [Stellaceae bacterium]